MGADDLRWWLNDEVSKWRERHGITAIQDT